MKAHQEQPKDLFDWAKDNQPVAEVPSRSKEDDDLGWDCPQCENLGRDCPRCVAEKNEPIPFDPTSINSNKPHSDSKGDMDSSMRIAIRLDEEEELRQQNEQINNPTPEERYEMAGEYLDDIRKIG